MNEQIDPERIAQIRQLVAHAAEGPWRVDRIDYDPAHPDEKARDVSLEVNAPMQFIAQTIMRDDSTEAETLAQDVANAEFIAHARSDIPYLLDSVAYLNRRLQIAEENAASATVERDRLLAGRQAEQEQLRGWLWLHHGCPIAALYGDDGEMQCNAIIHRPPLDFKRDPLEKLFASLQADASRPSEEPK